MARVLYFFNMAQRSEDVKVQKYVEEHNPSCLGLKRTLIRKCYGGTPRGLLSNGEVIRVVYV